MKTTEEYLDDYFNKYNELKNKNELWRLCVSLDEFRAEIEKIREYGIEARKTNYLNEYHIQRNEKASVSVLLMGRMTKEEFIDQAKRLKKFHTNDFPWFSVTP